MDVLFEINPFGALLKSFTVYGTCQTSAPWAKSAPHFTILSGPKNNPLNAK